MLTSKDTLLCSISQHVHVLHANLSTIDLNDYVTTGDVFLSTCALIHLRSLESRVTSFPSVLPSGTGGDLLTRILLTTCSCTNVHSATTHVNELCATLPFGIFRHVQNNSRFALLLIVV